MIARLMTMLGLALLMLPATTLQAIAEPPVLSELVALALENNPELQSAESRWQGSQHRIVQAQTLDDPVLTLSFSNFPVDTFSADDTPMTSRDITLAQKLPFPGKLEGRGDLAEQQAAWNRHLYQDSRLQLASRVREGFYTLWFVRRSLGIAEQNLALLDQIILLTESRYQVGAGLQQDVLKAQVERSKLQDRIFALRQQELSALAGLNTLLSRPTETAVETPVDLDIPAKAELLPPGDEELQSARPLFAAYQSQIDRYRSQKKLADLDYRPDFTLFAGYKLREANRADDGVDFVTAGISINLPIWQQRRGESVAEASSGIRMAQHQMDEFRNQVGFTIRDGIAQYQRSREQALLYSSGIIPQAQQTLEASMSAYQVGKIGFISLLDAEVMLFNYQVEYSRSLAECYKQVARLEAASGGLINLSDVKPDQGN